MTLPPTPNFSLALEVLAKLSIPDADLLARELNLYSEAIRSRTGRTTFTALELQTLFWRMWDVAKLTPEVSAPVDMDELASAIKPQPAKVIRRIE